RHDGRPCGRDPCGARRARLRRDADRLLRRQVRLRVLRAFPRRRRLDAGVRRPARLPAGSRQRARGAARVRARRRGGRRRAAREAGAAEPRRAPRGARALRPAGRRLQHLGRVRDAEGRRRARLDRRAAGRAGVADGDLPGRRRPRGQLLDEGAGGLVVALDLWDTIAQEAGHESRLWFDALASPTVREPVFSPLAEERYGLGLETIYEGYLLHYGRPRLFAPADADTALLLGDYLYAHGLVRIAEAGPVEAVSDLAELISLCAQLRADGLPGDGEAWAATAATLGRGEDARLRWRPGPEAERALEKHPLRGR